MIALIGTIACSTFIFVIFRIFERFNIGTFQAIVANYFTAFLCGILVHVDEVRAESFTVSDISTSSNYVVNISPSGNLNDNLLITHAFAAGNNTVSGIFYSPSTFAGQTTNFFIAAHRID